MAPKREREPSLTESLMPEQQQKAQRTLIDLEDRGSEVGKLADPTATGQTPKPQATTAKIPGSVRCAQFLCSFAGDETYWTKFWKVCIKNSKTTGGHDYREDFMTRTAKKQLNVQEISMVYFVFCLDISRPRSVLKSLREAPDKFKSALWYPKVVWFVELDIQQDPDALRFSDKLPAAYISTLHPGLTLLLSLRKAGRGSFATMKLALIPAFSQMNLNSELQALADGGYLEYRVHVTTAARDRKCLSLPGLDEIDPAHFQVMRCEKFNLLLPDLKEIVPKDPATGYTMAEVELYLKLVASMLDAESGTATQ